MKSDARQSFEAFFEEIHYISSCGAFWIESWVHMDLTNTSPTITYIAFSRLNMIHNSQYHWKAGAIWFLWYPCMLLHLLIINNSMSSQLGILSFRCKSFNHIDPFSSISLEIWNNTMSRLTNMVQTAYQGGCYKKY